MILTIAGRPILLPQNVPDGNCPIIVTSLLHADGILALIHKLDLKNPVVTLRQNNS